MRRGVKKIEHFTTPVLRQPTLADRSRLKTSTHIWKYGDRFYKLAHQFYGDTRYWWVIAWYNGIPTEAEANTGDVIEIPLDISETFVGFGGVTHDQNAIQQQSFFQLTFTTASRRVPKQA